MATPEEQVQRTEGAFKRLAEKGKEFPSATEIALEVMVKDQNRRRTQRSRAANSIRDLLAFDRRPSKPSFSYRHQTALALITLAESGRLDARFLDENGRLRKDPPLPRSSEDKRYRLIPAETDGQAEKSPQDRFEDIARRIENLPGATREGEGDDAVTQASAELSIPKNPTWPRSTTVKLTVDYLPSRAGAPSRDPQSISAEWASPLTDGGTGRREEHMSAGQLDDSDVSGRILESLEDTVQAVELTHVGARAAEGVRQILAKTFAGPPTIEMNGSNGSASAPISAAAEQADL